MKTAENKRKRDKNVIRRKLQEVGLLPSHYTLTSKTRSSEGTRTSFSFSIKLNEGIVAPQNISEIIKNLSKQISSSISFC